MEQTKKPKKRKYIRRCGVCGERFDQKDMIRDNSVSNGWICHDCHLDKHPEYYIESW